MGMRGMLPAARASLTLKPKDTPPARPSASAPLVSSISTGAGAAFSVSTRPEAVLLRELMLLEDSFI